MALRLLQAGYEVSVWNRSRDKTLPAIAAGAIEAGSPAELCQRSDIIVTCVLDHHAMEQVVFGPSGIAESGSSDKLLVDHSSMSPDETRRQAKKLESETGMRWVDAPVSGGTKGAKDGTLVILAGGESEDIKSVSPVLSAYSSRITHFGAVGTGQVAKLCNQVIAGTTMLTVVEAMRLASDAGLDISKLPEAFKGGMADSLPFQSIVPRIVVPPEEPMGQIVSMLKDLEGALALGAKSGSVMPITKEIVRIYKVGVEKGCGLDEPTALYTSYKDFPNEYG